MIKRALFGLLLIALAILGCSNLAPNYMLDLSQNKINSLTAASQQLLSSASEDVNIAVYSPNMQVLDICNDLLQPYQQFSKHVKIKLLQTVFEPGSHSNLALFTNNNLIVTYKGLQQAIDIDLDTLSEAQISSLLQKVLHINKNWLVFTTGHQEADPSDQDEFGVSKFAHLFAAQGMHPATLNLSTQNDIPSNTGLLVVANPKQNFSAQETKLLKTYLANGGDLLWFTEPYSQALDFLQQEFGLTVSKGVAIDPNATQFGSPHPAIKIMSHFAQHELTNNLNSAIILPWSGNIEMQHAKDWQPHVFLTTTDDNWLYDGPATSDLVTLAKGKLQSGPLNLGVTFSRKINSTLQHVIVIADSSFITNKYLSLYANTQFATNILQWSLTRDPVLVFSKPEPRDASYVPSKIDRFMFKYFFTLLLPGIFVFIGFAANNWHSARKIGLIKLLNLKLT